MSRYVITFAKIGTSWTDPNPNAVYDVYMLGPPRIARRGDDESRTRAHELRVFEEERRAALDTRNLQRKRK